MQRVELSLGTYAFWGPVMAALVLLAWAGCLAALLQTDLVQAPVFLLVAGVLVQAHLYSGVFITAHDAMHGLVHPRKWVNTVVGWVCALLFAFNWYPRLYRNHHRHHDFVATDKDPDVHPGGFWHWYVQFLRHYLSVGQFLAMAITYNLLQLWVPWQNLVLFWMLPAILSTLQIFYFGTYAPHRPGPATENPERSRSLPRNHLWAFFSCYFFGYHREHHAQPWLPWWALWRAKVNSAAAST